MQGFQYFLQSIDSSTVVWAQLAESWISLIAGLIEKAAPFPCQGLSQKPERCWMIAETKYRATLTDVWQYPRLAKQNLAYDSLAVFSLYFGCIHQLTVTSSLHLLVSLPPFLVCPASSSFYSFYCLLLSHHQTASSPHTFTFLLTLDKFHYKIMFLHEVFHEYNSWVNCSDSWSGKDSYCPKQ